MSEAMEEKAKRLSEIEEEDGEEQPQKGKKKTKAPKAPKPPKKKAPKAAKPPKKKPPKSKKQGRISEDEFMSEHPEEKKKHPVVRTLILTSAVWLLLLGALVCVCRLARTDTNGDLEFILDPDGVIRGPILLFLNPEELSREDYYSLDFEYIEAEKLYQEEMSADLEARELEMDERESELDDRESELDDRESEVESTLEKINDLGTQDGTTSNDILIMAKQIQTMSPAKAAAALQELDMKKAAKLISLMSSKKAGPILDAMDTDKATEIMDIMTALLEIEE